MARPPARRRAHSPPWPGRHPPGEGRTAAQLSCFLAGPPSGVDHGVAGGFPDAQPTALVILAEDARSGGRGLEHDLVELGLSSIHYAALKNLTTSVST